jgi:shikimate dehydrogenase
VIPKFLQLVFALSHFNKREKSVKRVFLLGSKISKSISPVIQNKAFEKAGFAATYELLQVSEGKFSSVMRKMQSVDDVLGFNITAPYKETILPYVSKLDPQSKAIGAVNTVKFLRNGKMIGFNTDVEGIFASLSRLDAFQKREKCVILGAGGAARACVYAVLKSGFRSISILNRSSDRAEQVRAHFERQFPKARINVHSLVSEEFAREIQNANLLINAVTNPFPIAVDFSGAPKKLKLLDLGYKEPSSILIQARDAKIDSLDGLLMLVEQGAKSFEIWTGLEAPRRTMLLAAKRQIIK